MTIPTDDIRTCAEYARRAAATVYGHDVVDVAERVLDWLDGFDKLTTSTPDLTQIADAHIDGDDYTCDWLDASDHVW